MSYLTSLIMKEAEKQAEQDFERVRKSKYSSKRDIVRDAYNSGVTNNQDLIKILYRYEQEGKLIRRHHVKNLPEKQRIANQVKSILCSLAKDKEIDKEYKTKKERDRERKVKIIEEQEDDIFADLSICKDAVWESMAEYEEDILDE